MPDQPPDFPPKGFLSSLNAALSLGANAITDTGRRIITGALLGVCLAFIVALLAVPHRDTPLQIALALFVFDIPFLIAAFMLLLQDIPDELTDRMTPKELFIAGLAGVHAVSYFPVVAGFLCVLWHFGLAYVALLVAGMIAMLLTAALTIWLYQHSADKWAKAAKPATDQEQPLPPH